ncbi:FAD/NAD(P)-binding domain-containing protein [Parathielavia appendiculata]|uniref:FAD/NAD(P)-binding domain-containing protein n=1 Tax=Parathielavia appendiculata TaxID=2587402 RepID=A0AAN6TTM4_9PEZI|nr:FAD/NAD(P)-binding domain-containing protein [Parathielavia appendiculata]
MHAIIVGAGPAGLAAALALHQQSTDSSPIRVTILELRPGIQTLGGAVNLTPLAMRYLDALGVAPRLRPKGAKVSHINMVSHRTGSSLGRLWPNVDAIRVLRQHLVEAMVDTVRAVPNNHIELRYGAKVTSIQELGDASSPQGSIHVRFTDTTTTTTGGGHDDDETMIQGDLVLGCDGIHSFVRGSLVDPTREKTYSGRATAYGFIPVSEPGNAGITAAADGSPVVGISTVITAQLGSLLVTFFEPSLSRLYLAAVIAQPENQKTDGREGKRATGAERDALRSEFSRRFRGGKLAGLEEALERCEEWVSFPVYMLPPGGVWSKGRALLLGDAAHAMPPQGESTGVAIEDAVLLAHVFSRRDRRSIPQMFADYEVLRRPVIQKTYQETLFRWEKVGDKSWFKTVVMDWLTTGVIWFMNSWSKDSFGRDVRELELPTLGSQ